MFRYVLAVVLLCASSFAQTTKPPESTPLTDRELLQALVNEVRELRLTLERTTSASQRIQLALQRIQIQEQKIDRLSRDLQAVKQRNAEVQPELARAPEQLHDMESRISQASDPTLKKQLELEYAQMKIGLDRMTAANAVNVTRESELTSQLEEETARLREVNERIAALERALDGRQ